jgi:UDP-N-acetylmuramate-alanine ligase
LWQEDADYLGVNENTVTTVLDSGARQVLNIGLLGQYNRLDAWLVAQAIHYITNEPLDKLTDLLGRFPGLSRRMEEVAENLYSDYAHTPEKIRGAMSVATEMATDKGQRVIVVYEPLTNRRQHYMLDDYKDCFSGAAKLYWLPSYLAREDPNQRVIPPEELISHLDDPSLAAPAEMDDSLKQAIQQHLNDGDLVIGMAGGGGGSLDEWLRQEFTS